MAKTSPHEMPGGGFPIPDVPHLKKAVMAFGRAKNKRAAKNHIIKHAKRLERTDLLPSSWGVRSKPATTAAADGAPDFSDGVMIAVYPPPAVAQALAVQKSDDDTGAPLAPEDLHVTLVYLGKTSDFNDTDIAVMQNAISTATWLSPPLNAKAGGAGAFLPPADPSGKQDYEDYVASIPRFYSIDSPGISDLRSRLVNALISAGITPAVDHGFIPHMTIRYGGSNLMLPAGDVALSTWDVPMVAFVVGTSTYVFQLGHEATTGDIGTSQVGLTPQPATPSASTTTSTTPTTPAQPVDPDLNPTPVVAATGDDLEEDLNNSVSLCTACGGPLTAPYHVSGQLPPWARNLGQIPNLPAIPDMLDSIAAEANQALAAMRTDGLQV